MIFVGLIKGFLRLSKRQKSMLTKPMKRLMYKFGMTVNPALLMKNRKVLIKLVKVLLNSTESELVKHKEIRSMSPI